MVLLIPYSAALSILILISSPEQPTTATSECARNMLLRTMVAGVRNPPTWFVLRENRTGCAQAGVRGLEIRSSDVPST